MKIHSYHSPRSSSDQFQSNNERLRWTEWLIAIFFVVSLLIGSGIFIKAGNAATLKANSFSHLSYNELSMMPGPLRTLGSIDSLQEVTRSEAVTVYVESDDSCELKEVKKSSS